MPLNDNALVDLETVKQYLKIEFGDDDSLLERLINNASDMIEKRHGRIFKKRQITQTISGAGDDTIILDAYPVISVDEVTAAGAGVPAAAIPLSNLSLDPAHGYLWKYYFSPDLTYTITYTAGLDEIPGTVEIEALMLVADLYEGRGGGVYDY